MLIYLHPGDALWLSILWVFIIPALLVAFGVWWGLKPSKSNDEKANPLQLSLNETNNKED
jgi:cytochrome c-type biogenesis protein CcmH/NrfF